MPPSPGGVAIAAIVPVASTAIGLSGSLFFFPFAGQDHYLPVSPLTPAFCQQAGVVFQDPVLVAEAPSRMGGSVVTFTPGARTAWHAHPVGQDFHVSQHVGGMIISSRPLIELVPVEPAAMEGRFICQWDKDSCDDARFINHSCAPNCYAQVIDGVIWIRAAKTIEPGEELTYNYQTDGEKTIECRCRPGCKTRL